MTGSLLLAAWLLPALAPPAAAQDLRAWQGMHEGLLKEAAEGDAAAAQEWYRGLLASLPADDPSAGELHYWLGRASYLEGDIEAARRELKLAGEDPTAAPHAKALLGQIDAQELRIRRLPVTHDFRLGTAHWLHSWQHGDKGTIEALPLPPTGEPAMAWTTTVTDREDDQIVCYFDNPTPAPTSIRMSLRSESFPAYVLPSLHDDRGRRYAPDEPIAIPTDRWVPVELTVADFLPREGNQPLQPQDLEAFVLQDVTAFFSSDRGANIVYVDEVHIR